MPTYEKSRALRNQFDNKIYIQVSQPSFIKLAIDPLIQGLRKNLWLQWLGMLTRGYKRTKFSHLSLSKYLVRGLLGAVTADRDATYPVQMNRSWTGTLSNRPVLCLGWRIEHHLQTQRPSIKNTKMKAPHISNPDRLLPCKIKFLNLAIWNLGKKLISDGWSLPDALSLVSIVL